MFKTKTTTPTANVEISPAMQVLQLYTKVNDQVYYKKVSLNNLNELKKEINQEIPLLNKQGITVILVDGELKKEFLAPRIDPYQLRKDLDDALDRENNKNFTTQQIEDDSTKSLFGRKSSKIQVEDL